MAADGAIVAVANLLIPQLRPCCVDLGGDAAPSTTMFATRAASGAPWTSGIARVPRRRADYL